MRWEVWEETSAGAAHSALIEATDEARRQQLRLFMPGTSPKLVLEFEAATFDEACQKRNDHYGWGTHKPMPEDPDPVAA